MIRVNTTADLTVLQRYDRLPRQRTGILAPLFAYPPVARVGRRVVLIEPTQQCGVIWQAFFEKFGSVELRSMPKWMAGPWMALPEVVASPVSTFYLTSKRAIEGALMGRVLDS